MSASNWSICPRCKITAKAEADARFDAAAKAYGKVPSDEYERLKMLAANPEKIGETLREDWELGMGDDGKFYVTYSCGCQHCDFAYSFRHEQQADVMSKAKR